jgi:RNA polymerase sigma factor (sigma-70 family)
LYSTLDIISDQDILLMLANPLSFERGFKLLMEEYQERIYWHVRRMVSSHEDADDVVQNCFIKVYKNIDRFEGKSKLYTWIYRIATNEALTYRNKQQKHHAADIDDEETGLANKITASDHITSDEVLKQLNHAIDRLPEKQRLVFSLRYFEELTYKEMSEVLDTSVGALKASYHHAVKKIEDSIKRYER